MATIEDVREGKLEPWEAKGLSGVETFVTDSPVVGMTISELEQKYGLCVHHIHEGSVTRATRVMRADALERKIEPFLTLHVWGDWEGLSRFMRDITAGS